MEILQLVDQLELVLNRGYRLPLSSSLVVSEEECMRLIDQMRISVPSAIKESQRMIAERDRILDNARREAESILEQARQHALGMIDQSAVNQSARQEAERIVARSREDAERMILRSRDEANALIRDAEDYTLNVLQQLVGQLGGSLQQAKNGIQAIEESRLDPAPQESVPPPAEATTSKPKRN